MRRPGCYALACCVLLAAAPLRAQTPAQKAQAQVLFESGRDLMKAGDLAAACPKFAESQRLDPALGTLLNLARCYDDLGKTASAWISYLEVASLARSTGQEKRERYAQERVDALKPLLSYLTVVVSGDAAGIAVTRAGQEVPREVWGSAVPIDPGSHEIVATAEGKVPWRRTIEVGAQPEAVRVEIPVLGDAPSFADPQPAPQPGTGADADDGVWTPELQWILGWVGVGVGAAGVGVGFALGVVALNTDEESFQHCEPNDVTRCNAEGVALRDKARALEVGSVIAWVAGGAFAVGGVVLLLTTPDDEVEVALRDWTVIADDRGATVTYRGRW